MNVKAILIDIAGVLHVDYRPLDGSIKAYQLLKESGIPYKFVTNTDMHTRQWMVNKLREIGFDMTEDEVFTSPNAVRSIFKNHNISRPYCLIHPELEPEFADYLQFQKLEKENKHDSNLSYDSVLIADMQHHLNYTLLNKGFQILMENENSILVSSGGSRYYRDKGQLSLDVGAFTKALEFASGKQPIVAGKPSAEFFQSALAQIGATEQETIMIGDDLLSDVGGAQAIGIRGVLVRTGKYTAKDEQNTNVKPFMIVNNFLEIIQWILNNKNN